MYLLAAERGFARAQAVVGFCYDTGRGVPEDDIAAYAWYILASVQGSETANYYREVLVSLLTPEQLTEAQNLAPTLIK